MGLESFQFQPSASSLIKDRMKKLIRLTLKILNIFETWAPFVRVCVLLLFQLNFLAQSILNATIYSFALNKKKCSHIYFSLPAFTKNSFKACVLCFYAFYIQKKDVNNAFYFTKKPFLFSRYSKRSYCTFLFLSFVLCQPFLNLLETLSEGIS